jgi:hypothetical protein
MFLIFIVDWRRIELYFFLTSGVFVMEYLLLYCVVQTERKLNREYIYKQKQKYIPGNMHSVEVVSMVKYVQNYFWGDVVMDEEYEGT